MAVVYQLTFFLALGLLAMIGAIFVFAVSQVGRATESASREQQDILIKQKDAKTKQIEKIEQQLAEAKKVGQLDESKLFEQFQETKEEIVGYENELKRIKERIELIRRKGAVIYPGVAFLVVVALTMIASGLFQYQSHLTAALWLWIISIVALVFGIYRIFRTLGAIEQVTVTSQEATEKLPEAVKSALRELEAEKKPKLVVSLRETELPLRIVAESQTDIKFVLKIESGDAARDAGIFVHAPSVFEFLPESVQCAPIGKIQDIDHVSAYLEVGNFVRGMRKTKKVTLKAPSQPDNYIIYYRCLCEGYDGALCSLAVVVE